MSGFRLDERVEDRELLLLRNAGPGVGNPKAHIRAAWLQPRVRTRRARLSDLQSDGPARGRKLHGIGKQVDEDLSHALFVSSKNGFRFGSRLNHQLESARRRLRLNQCYRSGNRSLSRCGL